MNSTLTWLADLITHIIGLFLETFVDGLLPALFEWYFVTPFAIDFPLVHNLWLYVRLLTAPFLFVGLFVSYYKFVKGDVGKNLVVTFFIALIFSASSLYASDYLIFIGNEVTEAIRNPILIEAYKDEKSDLKIVQEGLADDEIDFSAFSPTSVLKYSFGLKLDDSNDTSQSSDEEHEENNQENSFEDNLNKVQASKKYPGAGRYESKISKISDEELDENFYEVFLLENGGGGPIVCFIAMIELAIMCLFALLRLMVLMLTIGMISIFVVKDTFTGGNEDLASILILLIKTIAISLVFNLGWMASCILTRNETLVIIHPQFWAIIVYGLVIVFTYYFWVKQVINNIIKPSVEKIQGAQMQAKSSYGEGMNKTKGVYNKWAPEGVKNFTKRVTTQFGGGRQDADIGAVVEATTRPQNTSTLTNRQDYLIGLSSYDRYMADPEFFRNSDYDGKYESTSGKFYDEKLGFTVKNTR